MRLFIHDKCFEKLFDLPKSTAKKVLDFQKKFRSNSKSEAIHLEPISTFKDPQLRTARIDLKYRAIIRVPESGEDYYLLWVDNHDEAMDWARNKVFQWNEHTQAAQIFTAPESEEASSTPEVVTYEPKEIDEKLFNDYTNEELKQIGVPDSQIVLVRSLRDLDELGKAEQYLPKDAFENLFYLADGINFNLLIAEINEGKVASHLMDEQVLSGNNRRNFIEVDDELMQEIINGDLQKWQIFLHPSQRKLVESDFKGSVKVTGGAGTGKTVAALHRLKYLTNLPYDGDDRKTVFTTFTNALTHNLTQLAKQLSIDFYKIILTNIDSLVKDLALELNLISRNHRILDLYNAKNSEELWNEVLELNLSEFDSQFLISEYQGVILYNNVKTVDQYLKTRRIGRVKPISRKQKMEIWDLVEKYEAEKKTQHYLDRYQLFNQVADHLNEKGIRPYKHVISDEIQDLSNVELRFIRALVETKPNDLFLVGDPYQKIYDRKINFSAAGIAIRGVRSRQLRLNYRTSEEIKHLALSAIKGVQYDDFDGEIEKLNGYLSLFHGDTPTYETFKTKDKELDAILGYVRNLREGGFAYNEIAIASRTRDALKDVKTCLHKEKIPYNDITNNQVTDSSGVALSTFHSLKGIEYKAIILADVNHGTSPLQITKYDRMDQLEKESYLKSERSLLYVAISRAIKVLKITGVGIKSDLVTV